MLRRFIYLNNAELNQYIAALEGGLTTESTLRNKRSGGGHAGVDLKIARGSVLRSGEDETSWTISDTGDSRFARLLHSAEISPENLGWIEITDPDEDFSNIGIGAMVSWECDIYIPDFVQRISQSGETLSAIELMRTIRPSAEIFGLDTIGLPDNSQLDAASQLISGIKARLVFVGEDDSTNWKISSQLNDEFLFGEIEGRAIVVGKVAKKIEPGRWKPFLAFPGMNIVSRDDRRRLERQAPESGKEEQYLAGPAILLDLLAIYR